MDQNLEILLNDGKLYPILHMIDSSGEFTFDTLSCKFAVINIEGRYASIDTMGIDLKYSSFFVESGIAFDSPKKARKHIREHLGGKEMLFYHPDGSIDLKYSYLEAVH